MSTYRLHYSPGVCSFAVHAWRIALPVESWPHLHAHFERMDARPAVRRAFATERLDPVGSVRRATA